ncbi:putative hopanoid biosynthesis associated radical SAM protein(Hopanoid biosynthesis associated radical SAM protein HpnH,2-318) [Magnetospirillum sp. XM-1]|uniref:adenosyl-hopene transferase HpnH n=1 Tax=Magnetospirillum sp. XM-1 TaxID=1663591 RepID=UPI00073DF8E0|nr:adenosyl-hopene transferase HpnH [Magnetospirillum sp. XM-1]CUW39061.1 putative hopanoid biosynthesis associated radical SAM protein(Hopanoid biosynthesis associated radical SAM protein HpnH,2-318) [Magnetospirillum sp. XM-1]
MGVPLHQSIKIGSYIVKQHLVGNKRYPLVLMMEPLFRCNLTCAGCGKIDYPDAILNSRISVADALASIDECPAPVVVLAGGEPLLHREIDQIVEGALARGKIVFVCTNALLLEKKLDSFKPHKNFTWTVHLDGNREDHDRAVSREGTFDQAVSAIKAAKAAGFQVNINCTLFNNADAERMAAFFDYTKSIGIGGITLSPGYAYERAPDTEHFLNRRATKELFRKLFRLGKGKKWEFTQSSLFMDFLAGNQTYQCTPWGNPTRNVFGWQRPCYLLGEGYAKTYKELMEETDWESYGTGKYEKCADCMVHSGYEATAVMDTISNPLKAAMVALRGPKTEGPFAPDLPLDKQRPAINNYEELMAKNLEMLHTEGRANNLHRVSQGN